MINDPTITVSCDACNDEVELDLEYKYRDYSGKNGFYDTSTGAVEASLRSQEWIVDHENHYCCEECRDTQTT